MKKLLLTSLTIVLGLLCSMPTQAKYHKHLMEEKVEQPTEQIMEKVTTEEIEQPIKITKTESRYTTCQSCGLRRKKIKSCKTCIRITRIEKVNATKKPKVKKIKVKKPKKIKTPKTKKPKVKKFKKTKKNKNNRPENNCGSRCNCPSGKPNMPKCRCMI